MEASVVEAIAIDANREVASFKINRRMIELQRKRKAVEEQIKELQQQLIDKLEGCMESNTGRNADRKIRIMFLSSVASIFAFSFGFRTNFESTTLRISWPLVIGGGAVAYSLYCLKSVLFTTKQRAKAQELRVFLLKLAIEAVKEMPKKYTLDGRFKPGFNLGMPADLFAVMLKEEESDEPEFQ